MFTHILSKIDASIFAVLACKYMGNKDSRPFVSVVIANRNGSGTLAACLKAATGDDYPHYEVIVVDDASTDDSVEVIEQYPCRLVRLGTKGGASKARNSGAEAARGEVIFFTDADCVMPPGTIQRAAAAFQKHPDKVTGGTYSTEPYDPGFFNRFQAVFVNFSETKRPRPDYIATHAMVIGKSVFENSGGFNEDFMPILEDVEFSHRLRARGVKLVMQSGLEVRHIFGFDLMRSLKNAFRKARYWGMYSLGNRDLFRDTGTASFELKLNTALWGVYMGLTVAYALFGIPLLIRDAAEFYALNLLVNIRFLYAMAKAHGAGFLIKGTLYYTLVYPAPVALGGLSGLAGYLLKIGAGGGRK